ncbi:acyl-CoA dehydrogenase [Streptomyces hygroscopicus subsp. limoneus]|nr:acyl-CoA dehydrogenase [Streptomyces hygroscopicus subsp. limoneus]
MLREAGRVLARVPLLEHCAAAAAVQAYGSPELADRRLVRAGRGEPVLTVAAQGRTGHDPAELTVTARREGRAWLLEGVQTAVPWAFDADLVVVPAHVEGTAGEGAVPALVPREADGLVLAEQVSTSGELLAELRLRPVRVGPGEVIEAGGAREWLRGLLVTGTCAPALGLGERVLRMTGEYTGRREQFGYPIATFQAVAVQAADRYIDLRAMEATRWQAAWRIASGAPGALLVAGDVAVAKIWAAKGVRRVVRTAQHLHGGFGADTDYPLPRCHAWAKHLELSLGPAAAYEEGLGDLPATHPLG